MNLNKIASRLVLGVLLTVAAAGCKHTPTKVTDVDKGGKTTSRTGNQEAGEPIRRDDKVGSTDNPNPFGTPPNPSGLHEGWAPNAEIFKAYTCHFDFDSSNVKAADKPNLEAVASQLKSNPAWAVRVEGNCDERGTEEYNRSLGERRALALRESLISLGIEATRVDTISYGEDKPVATGHDEAAWKQNRRGDFIQLTPPK
jgi:peptidoglycan-associated lipoprotein